MTSGTGRDPVGTARLRSPEVSVICTARNAASTIAQTIGSILAQDFDNWEMIIVDDGSTDETASIVDRLAQADPRIRLVVTGAVGRGRALNRALAEAEADLVANIDGDDESHPWRLRCQVEAMERYPSFPLLFTQVVKVYGSEAPFWPQIDASTPAVVVDMTRRLAVHNPVVHSSAMMRKSVVLELGGYDEARQFVFDYDLWVRCAAAGLRLGCIQLPLVAKRIHRDQSYLHAAHVPYHLAGARVQIRAIRALGIRRRFLPLIALRFLWGVIPARSRVNLRRLLSTLRRVIGEGRWSSS